MTLIRRWVNVYIWVQPQLTELQDIASIKIDKKKKNQAEVCTYQTELPKRKKRKESCLTAALNPNQEACDAPLSVAVKLSVCSPYRRPSGDSVAVRFVNSKMRTTAAPINQYQHKRLTPPFSRQTGSQCDSSAIKLLLWKAHTRLCQVSNQCLQIYLPEFM